MPCSTGSPFASVLWSKPKTFCRFASSCRLRKSGGNWPASINALISSTSVCDSVMVGTRTGSTTESTMSSLLQAAFDQSKLRKMFWTLEQPAALSTNLPIAIGQATRRPWQSAVDEVPLLHEILRKHHQVPADVVLEQAASKARQLFGECFRHRHHEPPANGCRASQAWISASDFATGNARAETASLICKTADRSPFDQRSINALSRFSA